MMSLHWAFIDSRKARVDGLLRAFPEPTSASRSDGPDMEGLPVCHVCHSSPC